MQIYDLSTRLSLNRDLIQSPNLCDRFSDEDLTCIGDHVWRGYTADMASRSEWFQRTEAAMDLAMQVARNKNFPWPGCSNIVFPLITIASLQFSSRSYSNIIQGNEVVRYRVGGPDPNGVLTKQANLIGRHMSWQVLKEDVNWEEQHDKLLINLCIVGLNHVKTYFSPSRGHNVSDLVMARDLVVNYWAKSFTDCPRKTHIIPLSRNEIYERVRQETFSDVLDEAWFRSIPALHSAPETQSRDRRTGISPQQPDEDTPFRTLEQHRYLDLDKDGYAEPYIVTIEEGSHKVLRITSRIERMEDVETINSHVARIKAQEYFTKFGFVPAPDGSIYDVGFGRLIGPLNEGVNSGINQLLDAGTMANSNGGFLGRGAKIRGGAYTFAPWEWKRVDSTGDDLRKSMVQLPVRDPSTVMFQLIGLLINYTDRLAGTVDTMVGENPGQNTKTGVANQTLEQGMQVYGSIFKRIWRSCKEEFIKLHQLNRQFLPSFQQFGDIGETVRREDYNNNSAQIEPVADPRLLSDTQRVQQAQVLAERATVVPGYDPVEVENNLLSALRVDGKERFYPGPEKRPPPPDPKAQVESAKLQLEGARLAFERQKFAFELMEEKRLNTAKIAQLQAQSAQILREAQLAGREADIRAVEVAISALTAHNDMLTKRMELAQQKEESATEESSSE